MDKGDKNERKTRPKGTKAPPKGKGGGSTKSVRRASKSKATSEETALRDADYYASEISRLLKELGLYNASFAFLIESCSQLIVARNKAFDILRSEELIQREVSREGDIRLKSHPICGMYIELSKELRQVLGELTMTARTSSVVDGDALDQLNSKIVELLST